MSRQDRREHDRALELAASAIDYGLTVAQSAALDAHLMTCSACARSAAAMRGDAIALRPRSMRLPSRRVDDAVATAIAGRRAASPSLLVLVALALLLVALLGATAAAGSLLLRGVSPPLPARVPVHAVFVREAAVDDPSGAWHVVAVSADGAERYLTSVYNVAPEAYAQRAALSEGGHLALPVLEGSRRGWVVVDVTTSGSKPVSVALPGQSDLAVLRGVANWGPGERLAIVLDPAGAEGAVAFVDPTTGAATIQRMPMGAYLCWADRCAVWAADGSGVVLATGDGSQVVVLGPDGRTRPLASKLQPQSIGDRSVNEAGEVLLGGTTPMDLMGDASGYERLSVRRPSAPWYDSHLADIEPVVEIADHGWAADGHDVWLLTAQWLPASRPVTLERLSPPFDRMPVAHFVSPSDVPPANTYAPAATFVGIAPDDSLAVVQIPTTSSEPIEYRNAVVDLRTGDMRATDGRFVGWLAAEE